MAIPSLPSILSRKKVPILLDVVAAMTTEDTGIPNINADKMSGAVGGDVDRSSTPLSLPTLMRSLH
jgi:hypothetical protein